MFEQRTMAHRVTLSSLLLLALVGCAPALHTVRLQTAEGQVQTTTPRPRPPLALPKEQVCRAVRALAGKVVPVADPVEFARERFEVPLREGVYLFNPRTKELRPADSATEATEEPPAELLEQARQYLKWCEGRHQPGDCLGALRGRRTMDAHGRYTVAMGIAIAGTFEATKESLEDMVGVKEVLGMVVAGVTMYAVLWVIPEPVSKGIAAAVTIVLVGYVGVHTLYTLGRGWADLIERADAATTFDELWNAGEDYAKVMGADNARILVMVATAAMGSGLSQLAKLLPTLPGAAHASRLAVAEGSVALEEVGAVQSVKIAKDGLTISLESGAVLMSTLSGSSERGPHAQIVPAVAGPAPKSIPERIQALKDAGVRGTERLDKIAKEAASQDGSAGEIDAAERWLRQGVKGEEIEALAENGMAGRKTPDYRVRGELTEIKTRKEALDDRWIKDRIREASEQMKKCGLDADRPRIGVAERGPQGQVELQLDGGVARAPTFDEIERQVLGGFTSDRGTGLYRVRVYREGRLIGEWIRTVANAIVRSFPRAR